MVAVKTSKDPNQNGRKEVLNHLNENLEKLIKVLENKLPATTSGNTNLSKTEEARQKKEEEQRRKEEKRQREEDLKAIKEALKDTIPADTRRDIGSTAIGSFTGINPVLVKTFGLDKLVQSIGVAAIHKVRSRLKSKREERLEAEAGGAENNATATETGGEEQESTAVSSLGTAKKQKKATKLNQTAEGIINNNSDVKSDSAVEQNKQNQNPFKKGLDTIVNLLRGNKKGEKEEKEKEQESWLKKILKAGILGLLMAGMFKAFGGAGGIIKEFMDSFFVNTLGLGIGGAVISDMLPGAVVGAKLFGLQGALIGGALSLAYFSIKRVVKDYKSREKMAEQGVYSKAASICGMSANTYMGMIAGGITGFMIYGPIGAIAGALIGAGAGWIADKVMDAKLKDKIARAKASSSLEREGNKVASDYVKVKQATERYDQLEAEDARLQELKYKTDRTQEEEEELAALKATEWERGRKKNMAEYIKSSGENFGEEYGKAFGKSDDDEESIWNEKFDTNRDGRISVQEFKKGHTNWAGYSRTHLQYAIEEALKTPEGATRANVAKILQRQHVKRVRDRVKNDSLIFGSQGENELNTYDMFNQESNPQQLQTLETSDPTTEAREQKMKNDTFDILKENNDNAKKQTELLEKIANQEKPIGAGLAESNSSGGFWSRVQNVFGNSRSKNTATADMTKGK